MHGSLGGLFLPKTEPGERNPGHVLRQLCAGRPLLAAVPDLLRLHAPGILRGRNELVCRVRIPPPVPAAPGAEGGAENRFPARVARTGLRGGHVRILHLQMGRLLRQPDDRSPDEPADLQLYPRPVLHRQTPGGSFPPEDLPHRAGLLFAGIHHMGRIGIR